MSYYNAKDCYMFSSPRGVGCYGRGMQCETTSSYRLLAELFIVDPIQSSNSFMHSSPHGGCVVSLKNKIGGKLHPSIRNTGAEYCCIVPLRGYCPKVYVQRQYPRLSSPDGDKVCREREYEEIVIDRQLPSPCGDKMYLHSLTLWL